MIYSGDGTRLYSPRGLIAFLESDFAAWCERMQAERARSVGARSAELEWVAPDEDKDLALLARKGDEHEQRYLISVRQREPGMVELTRDSATSATLDAIRCGAPVIYQAHLTVDDWHGYPDFLFRADKDSESGQHHYNAWDTKLARSAKPYFLIQLCAYAELLEAIQGVRPNEIVFVFGHGEERHFSTNDYYFYYLQLKKSFLDFQTEWREGQTPDPGLDWSWGRWSTYAETLLAESDHLSLVANITRGQVKHFEKANVTCLAALAASTVPHVARISDPVLQRLRTQARPVTWRDSRKSVPYALFKVAIVLGTETIRGAEAPRGGRFRTLQG